MLTTQRLAAHALADMLERETRDRAGADAPEGSATVTMSVTLVLELVKALRGEE